ncbi:MAG: class I adenylate-forming enzyme family protein, partial [Planctomycetota bacterium]
MLRLPRTPAHVMATIAAWWEGITLCPVAPADPCSQAELLDIFDARLIIDTHESSHALRPTASGAAPAATTSARNAGSPTAGIALILSTSGTLSVPKRVALSHGNVLHQLTTHCDALGITSADHVLSVLPWHHAFGLLVDLWPSLLSGATVEVDDEDGRSPASMVHAITSRGVTRISMVPLQASGVASFDRGEAALGSLAGGVVGGAPISHQLAETLCNTHLQVGYGQTETSPGITLGRPGVFCEGILGTPVGCTPRIVNGELHVRGPNVCAGFWAHGRIERLHDSRWHATGDLVERVDGSLRFVGRRDHRFKLPNGRMVDAPRIEHQLRAVLPDSQVVLLPAEDGGITIVALCAEST